MFFKSQSSTKCVTSFFYLTVSLGHLYPSSDLKLSAVWAHRSRGQPFESGCHLPRARSPLPSFHAPPRLKHTRKTVELYRVFDARWASDWSHGARGTDDLGVYSVTFFSSFRLLISAFRVT